MPVTGVAAGARRWPENPRSCADRRGSFAFILGGGPSVIE